MTPARALTTYREKIFSPPQKSQKTAQKQNQKNREFFGLGFRNLAKRDGFRDILAPRNLLRKSRYCAVVHMVYPQIVKTPDFCVFLHFLVPKNPTQGSKFSRKKKIFFLRFFDFLTRRWPIQNALVVQKMTGELTLDAQNSPILAFFDFLVPEGYLGCSEQASKHL